MLISLTHRLPTLSALFEFHNNFSSKLSARAPTPWVRPQAARRSIARDASAAPDIRTGPHDPTPSTPHALDERQARPGGSAFVTTPVQRRSHGVQRSGPGRPRPTGTGKTAAFLLPIMRRLLDDAAGKTAPPGVRTTPAPACWCWRRRASWRSRSKKTSWGWPITRLSGVSVLAVSAPVARSVPSARNDLSPRGPVVGPSGTAAPTRFDQLVCWCWMKRTACSIMGLADYPPIISGLPRTADAKCLATMSDDVKQSAGQIMRSEDDSDRAHGGLATRSRTSRR